MTEVLAKHKWKMAWCCFALLILVFTVIAYEFNSEPWFSIFLQVFGLLLTIYPTVLIFVQSRYDSEKSMQTHLDHLRQLNQQEIDTMQQLFQKQIDALNLSTQKQIENYATQTTEVVKRLEDNSVLLAEILLRQLEEDATELNNKLSTANAKYADRKQWKFMRTLVDKANELSKWEKYINYLQERLNYINTKWKAIKEFLNGKE